MKINQWPWYFLWLEKRTYKINSLQVTSQKDPNFEWKFTINHLSFISPWRQTFPHKSHRWFSNFVQLNLKKTLSYLFKVQNKNKQIKIKTKNNNNKSEQTKQLGWKQTKWVEKWTRRSGFGKKVFVMNDGLVWRAR